MKSGFEMLHELMEYCLTMTSICQIQICILNIYIYIIQFNTLLSIMHFKNNKDTIKYNEILTMQNNFEFNQKFL